MTDMIPHADSAGVWNPHLNIFKVPLTDLSMSSRCFVKINPFNTGINSVTFQVDPQEDFIDLSESVCEVELAVMKDNNTALAAADLIGQQFGTYPLQANLCEIEWNAYQPSD